MDSLRICTREKCENPAIATMTYDYRKAMAVVGPLAPAPIVGALDLCEQHAVSVTVPIGWELLHLKKEYEHSAEQVDAQLSDDGLTALADALRKAEKEAQKRRGKQRDAGRHSSTAGTLRNPWESHINIPSTRPHLTVIKGGAETE